MTVVLDSKFATADDAAKILGVPKTRVKWLKRLTEARTISSEKANGKRFALKAERKKVEPAKRRKQSRAKSKKSAH